MNDNPDSCPLTGTSSDRHDDQAQPEPMRRSMQEGKGEGKGRIGRSRKAASIQSTPTALEAQVVRYVRIARFADLTGYTEKAIRRKIAEGIWLDGREYRRAPDGRLCIDLEGYCRWVESGQKPVSNR